MHVEEDITSPDEFTVKEDLWKGRPIRKKFGGLADLGVGEDVEGREERCTGGGVLPAQDSVCLEYAAGSVGETTAWFHRIAFHKNHHASASRQFPKAVVKRLVQLRRT